MDISIVVPVYNSAESLRELVRQIELVLKPLASSYEIILVNDASKDNSLKVVDDLCRSNPHVRGFDLMRNYGQHNALLCGIRAARYKITVTMDDDLQNPASEIPKLLARLDEGYDVVYGYPERQSHGFFRDSASVVTKWVLKNAMGADTAYRISSFRAFKTELRLAFANYQGPHVIIDVLLTWATSSFSAVLVKHEDRKVGKSNYTLVKLVTHAFNLITGFTTFPLRLASWNGFACVIFGMALLLWVLVRYARGGDPPGFPFLASIVIIFSGAQLFAIGIFGEYLSRMYAKVIERPSFVVRAYLEGGEKILTTATLDESSLKPEI